MRFKKWPQLPGAGGTRAGHHHGSHTPTSPEAVLLGKMACQPKHFGRQCRQLWIMILLEPFVIFIVNHENLCKHVKFPYLVSKIFTMLPTFPRIISNFVDFISTCVTQEYEYGPTKIQTLNFLMVVNERFYSIHKTLRHFVNFIKDE